VPLEQRLASQREAVYLAVWAALWLALGSFQTTPWRMRVVKTTAAMQRLALKWHRAGTRVGFVPTMGYLHAGHTSLIQRARKLVGPKGAVVVSIYVNPTQFAPSEDLSRYPRDFKRDQRLCREAGADVIYLPNDEQMYPGKAEGRYSTYVVEERLSHGMEGESRPTHFRGVTTVVAKLFNIVLPEVSVFGAKDFQQAAVVQRMVSDLNFPVRIVVAPTVREPDGLAMSSRNKYLTAEQRPQATVLWRSIQLAKQAVAKSARPLNADRLREHVKRLVKQQPAARLDYVQFFDPKSFDVTKEVKRGTHMALAVFVGPTRLIDNARL
jgi:pantoate--beta-alanine ligase